MVTTSGSLDEKIDFLNKIILHKPQRKWRYHAQQTMRDLTLFSANSSGWQDLGDVETQTTPLEITSSGGSVNLTNDLSSSFTQTGSSPEGVSTLWNPNTNYMNFASNGIVENDIIVIRVDYDIAPNIVPMKYQLIFDFYSDTDGGGSNIFSNNIQMPEINNSAGVYRQDVFTHHFYVGSSIISGSMGIRIKASTAAEIQTNAFFIAINRAGI